MESRLCLNWFLHASARDTLNTYGLQLSLIARSSLCFWRRKNSNRSVALCFESLPHLPLPTTSVDLNALSTIISYFCSKWVGSLLLQLLFDHPLDWVHKQVYIILVCSGNRRRTVWCWYGTPAHLCMIGFVVLWLARSVYQRIYYSPTEGTLFVRSRIGWGA